MSKLLTVKHLDVLSIGKFVGTINALIAVVIGMLAAIATSISIMTNNHYGVFETIGLSAAIIAAGILVYPLVMFFVGWLYGILAALVFNLFIGVSGGITMTVDEETEKK
jgi:Ca2+/Na+ antiporter